MDKIVLYKIVIENCIVLYSIFSIVLYLFFSIVEDLLYTQKTYLFDI